MSHCQVKHHTPGLQDLQGLSSKGKGKVSLGVARTKQQCNWLHLVVCKAHKSLAKAAAGPSLGEAMSGKCMHARCMNCGQSLVPSPFSMPQQLFIFHVAHGQAFASSWSAKEKKPQKVSATFFTNIWPPFSQAPVSSYHLQWQLMQFMG